MTFHKLFLLLVIGLMSGPMAYGQYNELAKDSILILDKSSLNKELCIQVPEGAESITCRVEGQIESGRLSVKIYDPKGWRMVGFNLKAGKGSAKGHMEDIYDDPTPGQWKLKLKSSKATGNVKFLIATQ